MTSRVLMIGGANYTGKFVNSFTKQLAGLGKYRCSALAVDPTTLKKDLFERIDGIPRTDADLDAERDVLGHARDLVMSVTPCRWRWFGENGKLSSANASLKHGLHYRLFLEACGRRLPKCLGGYDLYHWHCFAPVTLPVLRLIPPDSKIILTIWGSDLLQHAGLDSYRIQLEAAERVSVITVGSLELRDTFLAKFGRHFIDKIRLVTYGAEYLDTCDQHVGERTQFLERFGIPDDKLVVCVGNNSSENNQHIRVLNEIGSLDAATRDRIAVLVPMTYGRQEHYLNDVRRAAENSGGTAVVIEEELSDDDIGRLRMATDIFVHLPVTDQFSASMCEALYAGSLLVTGAWLPYSRLRLNKIHFYEMGGVNELGSVLSFVVANFVEEKRRTAGASEKIARIMAWENTIKGWDAVYDELLGRP